MSQSKFFSFLFLWVYCGVAWAFNAGDYRSTSSPMVAWHELSKWEVYDGSSWVAAAAPPTHTAGTIYVQTTVWIVAATSADQIVVEPGGSLLIYADLSLNDGAGDDLLQNGGTLNLYAGIFALGSVTPTVKINSANTFSWYSNNLGPGVTLHIQAGATVNMSAFSDVLNEGTILNYGTMNWVNYSISVPFSSTQSGTIHNYGTFHITSDNGGTNFIYFMGQQLHNHPTGIININLTAVAPTATVYFQDHPSGAISSFDNDGTVNILQGRLNNFSSGTTTGTFDVSATGQLDFWFGTFTFNGATFAGVGPVKKYAPWVLASNISIANPFLYWGNSLSGNYTLDITGNATMYSCFIASGCTLKVGNSGTLWVTTSSARELHGTILNQGTVNWEEGEMTNAFTAPEGIVYNEGTWNIAPSSYDIYFYGLHFTNRTTGILNKQNVNDWYFANFTTGSFSTEAGSQLNIQGGIFYLQQTGTHNGNFDIATTGTLHIGSAFTNGLDYLAETLVNHGQISFFPIVMAGSMQQKIDGNGTINQLKINNAQHVSLLAPHTISTLLDLSSGNILLGNFSLSIGNATIQNASNSSYINTNGSGGLKANADANTSRLFPVGTTTSYTPATVSFLTGHQSDVFTLRCIDALYSDYTVADVPIGVAIAAGCVNRTWLVEETTPGGSLVTLTLHWQNTDEMLGFDRTTNVALGHYTSSAWDNGTSQSASQIGTFYQVTRSNLSSFSPFGVANVYALPVVLLNFTGKVQEKGIALTWQTAMEINAERFDIERSEDGFVFETIGALPAKGNSQSIENYTFDDASPLNGKSFYRLKNIDIDGNFAYSDVLAFSFSPTELSAYPNPFASTLNLTIQYASDETAQITIHNLQGQEVFAQQTAIHKGKNTLTLQLETLPSGVYHLSIKGLEKVYAYRITKK